MNTPNEERDVTNSAYNPFPEPQTIPSGWDLSEIICTPPSDPTMEQEDFRES